MSRPLFVLYGSATGNAEHIAKDLAAKCTASGGDFYDSVICAELDQFKKKCQKIWDVPPPGGTGRYGLIIVTSTTGNGDPPENANRFVRFVKRKTTPVTTFQHVSYAVLGLGDTNYDKFCQVGKVVDSRLADLGGRRAKPLGMADEATGLEDVVEPWVASVVGELREACLGGGADEGETDADADVGGECETAEKSGRDKKDEGKEAAELGKTNKEEAHTEGNKEDTRPAGTKKKEDDADGTGNGTAFGTNGNRGGSAPAPTSTVITDDEAATSTSAKEGTSGDGMAERVPVERGGEKISSPDISVPPDAATGDVPKVSGLDVLRSIAASSGFSLSDACSCLDESCLPATSASSTLQQSKSSCELLTKTASEAYLQQLAESGGRERCNVTVTSTSTACHYTMYNPFEARIVGARYLTKTDTAGAAEAAREMSTTGDGDDDGDDLAGRMERVHRAQERLSDAFPLDNDDPADVNNDKRVFELTLDLPDTSKQYDHPIEYEPGDAVGLLVPNSHRSVADTLVMLGEAHGVRPDDSVKMSEDDGAAADHELVSVYEALATRIDLCSLPKKRTLCQLSYHCSSVGGGAVSGSSTDAAEEEAAALRLLSSKTEIGEALYRDFVERYSISTYELFGLFPSCRPTLEALLVGMLPSRVPRYYSVCSSPLEHGGGGGGIGGGGGPPSLRIALSVVDYRTPPLPTVNDAGGRARMRGRRRRKRGLASGYLEAVASPFLAGGAVSSPSTSPGEGKKSVVVPIFPKPSAEFRLPADTGTPLVLIGPGTGVAPFIGFLSHRHHQAVIATKKRETEEETRRLRKLESVEGTWRGGYELTEEDLAVNREEDAVGLDPAGEFRRRRNDEEKKGNGGDESRNNGNGSGGTAVPLSSFGSIDMFFGCRTPHHDFLYEDEMRDYAAGGVLSKLTTAFSRLDDGGGPTADASTSRRQAPIEKTYVQHKMRVPEIGRRLAKLVLEDDASVYVCGDGNSMGKDVQDALVEVLVKYGGAGGGCVDGGGTSKRDAVARITSLDDGKRFVEEMKVSRKFLLDIWS